MPDEFEYLSFEQKGPEISKERERELLESCVEDESQKGLLARLKSRTKEVIPPTIWIATQFGVPSAVYLLLEKYVGRGKWLHVHNSGQCENDLLYVAVIVPTVMASFMLGGFLSEITENYLKKQGKNKEIK